MCEHRKTPRLTMGVLHWKGREERECMAVDRRKFIELGGFNRLFYPAYGEDLDLGFRAWRRGWRCIFEPASVVYHRESASFDTSEGSPSKDLMRHAQFLFQWASLPPA